MFIDRLLANLDVKLELLALCEVREGSRLELSPPGDVVVHCVLVGQGTVIVAGQPPRPIERGSMVVVPPGIAHRVQSHCAGEQVLAADAASIPHGESVHLVAGDGPPDLEMVCGRVTATYGGVLGLFDRLDELLIVSFADSPLIRASFEALRQEQREDRPGGEWMMTSIINQCFIVLLRGLCDSGDCRLPWLAAFNDDRLSRVLDEILERPEAPHNLETLARSAGMSRSAFSERFHEVFGRSPGDFLRETRLRRGARLLRSSDLPIKAVASKVGFSSRSHFSQAFAALFDATPAAYRATGSSDAV